MSDLPEPLQSLLPLLVADRDPAWLQCDEQGTLLSWGGALDAHGIEQLQQGAPADEQVDFLAGLLPLDDDGEPLHLSCVETGPDRYSEVFAARFADGDRVFLLDATPIQTTLRELLQKANELVLRRGRAG